MNKSDVGVLSNRYLLRSWAAELRSGIESSGLSLEDVSDKTKIPLKRLKRVLGSGFERLTVRDISLICFALGGDVKFTLSRGDDALAKVMRATLERRFGG